MDFQSSALGAVSRQTGGGSAPNAPAGQAMGLPAPSISPAALHAAGNMHPAIFNEFMSAAPDLQGMISGVQQSANTVTGQQNIPPMSPYLTGKPLGLSPQADRGWGAAPPPPVAPPQAGGFPRHLPAPMGDQSLARAALGMSPRTGTSLDYTNNPLSQDQPGQFGGVFGRAERFPGELGFHNMDAAQAARDQAFQPTQQQIVDQGTALGRLGAAHPELRIDRNPQGIPRVSGPAISPDRAKYFADQHAAHAASVMEWEQNGRWHQPGNDRLVAARALRGLGLDPSVAGAIAAGPEAGPQVQNALDHRREMEQGMMDRGVGQRGVQAQGGHQQIWQDQHAQWLQNRAAVGAHLAATLQGKPLQDAIDAIVGTEPTKQNAPARNPLALPSGGAFAMGGPAPAAAPPDEPIRNLPVEGAPNKNPVMESVEPMLAARQFEDAYNALVKAGVSDQEARATIKLRQGIHDTQAKHEAESADATKGGIADWIKTHIGTPSGVSIQAGYQ